AFLRVLPPRTPPYTQARLGTAGGRLSPPVHFSAFLGGESLFSVIPLLPFELHRIHPPRLHRHRRPPDRLPPVPHCLDPTPRRRPQHLHAVHRRPQRRRRRQSVLPRHVDPQPAARAQRRHRSGAPCLRQGREELQFACLALNQHLGNRRRTPEVPVDLKRRVIVEQIRQRRPRQQRRQILIRLLPVGQPSPEVDDPRATPPGAAAPVSQPPLDRRARCLRQFRR